MGNKAVKYVERKQKKGKKKNRYAKLEVDEEGLCTLSTNFKGKRTVRKTNKGIYVKNIKSLKK